MDIQHSNNTKAINEIDADVATMRIYMQVMLFGLHLFLF
jgi:hypothetical protein